MSLYVVKAKKTVLKSNFAPTDATFTLDELVDSQGNALAFASFGEFGCVVIKQGTLVEIVKFSGITQNANGSATLTVASNGRDILPITPYSGDSSGQNFLAGAEVIVSNDPLTMSTFANLNNANTWDEAQTFAVTPSTTGGNAVSDNQLVRKLQLDQAVLGITTSVKIVVEGTAGETLSAGQLIYLKSADNRWWKADADDPATVNNVILGIAQGAGTAGGSISGGILLRGVDSNQSGLTAGVKYYASNTAGAISTSAGTTEVTVGISKSTTELYFDPRFDQQLTEDQQDAIEGANSPSASNVFLTANDASTTPSANKLAKYDSNGDLSIPKIIKSYVCGDTITAGQPVCLYPYQSDGGVLKDTSGASGNGSTGQSITIGNNANRALVVIATAVDGSTVPTATFGGVSMTAVQTQGATVLFYLNAPATGAGTLTLSTSCSYTYHSLYNVSQSGQPEVSEKSTSNTTESITTLTDGAIVIAGIGSGQDNLTTWNISGEMGYYDSQNGGGNLGKTFSASSGQVFTPQAIDGTINTAGSACNYVACVIAPATAVTYGRIFPTSSATNALSQFADKYSCFVGIALESGVVGDTKNVVIGGLATGMTGVTPHKTIYLNDTSGTFGTTAGTNSKKIGQGHSTTALNIIQSI